MQGTKVLLRFFSLDIYLFFVSLRFYHDTKKELNKLVAVLNIFAGGHANLLTRHSLMFLFHKCISFHMRLHFGKLRYFFIFDACQLEFKLIKSYLKEQRSTICGQKDGWMDTHMSSYILCLFCQKRVEFIFQTVAGRGATREIEKNERYVSPTCIIEQQKPA